MTNKEKVAQIRADLAAGDPSGKKRTGGSGNANVDQYTTDKTPASVASAAGRAANGNVETNFGDYSSWIKKGGGYVPDSGLKMGASMSPENGKPVGASAEDKQGWDNLQNLSGMSTDEVMQYYMGNGQRDYDRDVRGAGTYLTSKYYEDMANENSDYNRDVAQRREAFANNPEELYKLAMEEGQKNNWGDAEYAEFFDIMDKMQEPDYLGNVWDYQSGFGNYRQRQEDDHMWQLFGGQGVSPNAINEKAQDIANSFGNVDDLNTVYSDIQKWAEETGATEENVNTLLDFIDRGLADKGYSYKFSESYSNRPKQEVDPKAAMQADLNTWTDQLNESTSLVNDMNKDIVRELIKSGKYNVSEKDIDWNNFDVEKLPARLRTAFASESEARRKSDPDGYGFAMDEMEKAQGEVNRLSTSVQYYDSNQSMETALDQRDENVNTAQTIADDLKAVEASNRSPVYQRVVNDYLTYVEETNPEQLPEVTNGVSRNEFTGDYEIPVDQLVRDPNFIKWYEDNMVEQTYNIASGAGDSSSVVVPEDPRMNRQFYTALSPYMDGLDFTYQQRKEAEAAADEAGLRGGIQNLGNGRRKFIYDYLRGIQAN